jgi:hypothetical protein
MGAVNRTVLDNVRSFGTSNSMGHGLYFDYLSGTFSADDSNITNSFFYNNTNYGIQLNSGNNGRIKNIRITNNYICDNANGGINDLASLNATVFNNTICGVPSGKPAISIAYNDAGTGHTFAPTNSTYYRNTFINISGDHFNIWNMTNRNRIENNTYDSDIRISNLRNNNNTNSIYENTPQNLNIRMFTNGNITFAYSGLKSLTLINTTVNATLSSPNNDVLNVSTNYLIVNNTNSYVKTLFSGDWIFVGSYRNNYEYLYPEVCSGTNGTLFSIITTFVLIGILAYLGFMVFNKGFDFKTIILSVVFGIFFIIMSMVLINFMSSLC